MGEPNVTDSAQWFWIIAEIKESCCQWGDCFTCGFCSADKRDHKSAAMQEKPFRGQWIHNEQWQWGLSRQMIVLARNSSIDCKGNTVAGHTSSKALVNFLTGRGAEGSMSIDAGMEGPARVAARVERSGGGKI